MKFSQKMPLYLFYTMAPKVKNDQKLKSRGGGGPAFKARHEADSFELAEWCERLPSRAVGLARRCCRRIEPRFLHFLLFSFSSFNVNDLPLHVKLLLTWGYSAAFLPLFSSAGSSWLLSHARFFPFFLPLPNPNRLCQSEPLP